MSTQVDGTVNAITDLWPGFLTVNSAIDTSRRQMNISVLTSDHDSRCGFRPGLLWCTDSHLTFSGSFRTQWAVACIIVGAYLHHFLHANEGEKLRINLGMPLTQNPCPKLSMAKRH